MACLFLPVSIFSALARLVGRPGFTDTGLLS